MAAIRFTSYAFAAAALVALSALAASGQIVVIKPKLAVSQSEFFEHMRASKESLYSLLPKSSYDFDVTVTIDEKGRVEKIVPDYLCSKSVGCSNMCRKIKQQTFRPFELSGRTTEAVATLHFLSDSKNPTQSGQVL